MADTMLPPGGLPMMDGRWPRWPKALRTPGDDDHVSVDEVATAASMKRTVVAHAFGQLAAGDWDRWLATPIRVRSTVLPHGGVRLDAERATLSAELLDRLADPVIRCGVAFNAAHVFAAVTLPAEFFSALAELHISYGGSTRRFDRLLAKAGVAEPLDLDGRGLAVVAAGLTSGRRLLAGREHRALRALWRLRSEEPDGGGLDAWLSAAHGAASVDHLAPADAATAAATIAGALAAALAEATRHRVQ